MNRTVGDRHGLVQYNIDDNNFTDYGAEYLSTKLSNPYGEFGAGTFYTQINETLLYTIRGTGEYINAYNLESFSFHQLDQTIPINVDIGGCLASVELPRPQLFVVGGRYYNGTGWNRRNTLQILDLSVGNWSMGPNMTQDRAGHGCVVVNDWLWAIGLYPTVESIHVPERSNSSSDTAWKIKGSLSTGVLFYVRLAVFEELIFVVGGCTLYTCPVERVIIIDTNTAKMDSTTLALPYAVLGMGIVVVDRTIYGFGGFGAG